MALILAFDTSADHCAACVLDGDEVLAAQAEEMTRGQAERLFPVSYTHLTLPTKRIV